MRKLRSRFLADEPERGQGGRVPRGGFAVDCNHGGGHCGAPAADIAGQWRFVKDHPFGVSPEPYANGLPTELPSYCSLVQ
ncbi:MAG: hypothetical protein JOZ69_17965 [Myxococcales bacterium]|nr:hypothetical protein [Myxococcales bacterium]